MKKWIHFVQWTKWTKKHQFTFYVLCFSQTKLIFANKCHLTNRTTVNTPQLQRYQSWSNLAIKACTLHPFLCIWISNVTQGINRLGSCVRSLRSPLNQVEPSTCPSPLSCLWPRRPSRSWMGALPSRWSTRDLVWQFSGTPSSMNIAKRSAVPGSGAPPVHNTHTSR